MSVNKFKVIPFGDFMQSVGLKPGMAIKFKEVEETLIIGNATPYDTVSSISHEGWLWDKWSNFTVVEVELLHEGPTFTPTVKKKFKDILQ